MLKTLSTIAPVVLVAALVLLGAAGNLVSLSPIPLALQLGTAHWSEASRAGGLSGKGTTGLAEALHAGHLIPGIRPRGPHQPGAGP